ncbi:hypothetical protein D9M71_846680 [compost metagenome]
MIVAEFCEMFVITGIPGLSGAVTSFVSNDALAEGDKFPAASKAFISTVYWFASSNPVRVCCVWVIEIGGLLLMVIV